MRSIRPALKDDSHNFGIACHKQVLKASKDMPVLRKRSQLRNFTPETNTSKAVSCVLLVDFSHNDFQTTQTTTQTGYIVFGVKTALDKQRVGVMALSPCW